MYRMLELTMKKPLFAALGVAGACAACCAIPLALPLLGGTAVAALVAAWGLDLGTNIDWTVAAIFAAGSAGFLIWSRRRPQAACDKNGTSTSCTLPPGGCGCSSKSSA